MERVRFISHRGKQILLIDCTGCKAAEMSDVLDDVENLVTSQPKNSVVTLSIWTGMEWNKQIFDRTKLVAVMDRPHVRKAAIVGFETMPETYRNALASFSARSFRSFNTVDEAKDWLSED